MQATASAANLTVAVQQMSAALQQAGMSSQEVATLLSQAGLAAEGAAAATQQMTLGFTSGLNDLGSQTNLFNTELQNLSIVQGQLGASGAAAWEAQTAAAGTATAATQEANAAMALSYSQVIQLGIAFKLLESFIVSALETAGKWERVTEALNATTGDLHGVADAMRDIPDLADKIGVSIDSAQQAFVRFARYGLDLKAIPGILADIQSGAIASGTSFETVAQSWERAVNTGSLMARTVQNMGLNMRDLAAVMGMVGHTDTEVSTAFKNIQDSLDGTSAASQRVAILMAALPDKIKGLAASVDDTTKSFVQLKNATTEAMDKIGTALEQVGQGGGLTALKVLLATISTAILGAITLFGELAKTIDAVFNFIFDASVAVGQAIKDALSGNISKAIDDLKAGGEKMLKDWMSISGEMAREFTTTGKLMSDMWGDATKTATTSTAAIGTAAAGMGAQVAQSTNQIVQSAGNASAATLKFVEDMNRGSASIASNFQDLGNNIPQTLKNAVTEFDKMSAAFWSGSGSATEYSKSLKALDAAFKDVNAGIENQKVAALLVAEKFREMGVAVTNAQINLKAIAAEMELGRSNATEYSAALVALNKAQMEFSGGLQNAHTVALLIADDYSKLNVTFANAATKLAEVSTAFQNHKATLSEVTAATRDFAKAELELNNGIESFGTAARQIAIDFTNIQNAAKNAETQLIATNEAFKQGHATMVQQSADVEDYIKKATAAAGGVESWQVAELKILDSHKKLEIALQNANTELGNANAALSKGEITLDEYKKYVDAAARAHDALYGAHKQQTQAVNELTSALQAYLQAQINATNAAQNALGVGYELQTQQLNLETALRQANTRLEEATQLFNQGAIGSGVLERAIQATENALKNLGMTTEGMTKDMTEATTVLTNASQAMDRLGNSAASAASKVASLRGGMSSFSGAGDPLSGNAGLIGMPAGPGGGTIQNINLQMKPGDAWDFWTAMSSPQFASMVSFGGPASMGNVTNWQTSGVMGTPQELAALAAQQLQQTLSTQQALMKAYEELRGHTAATSTAISALGTASAATAATISEKLNKSYQDAFVALQAATDAFQNHVIDEATYDKAVQAYKDAYTALTGTATMATAAATALSTLAASTDDASQTITSTDKALVTSAGSASTALSSAASAAQTFAEKANNLGSALGSTTDLFNAMINALKPSTLADGAKNIDNIVHALGSTQTQFDAIANALKPLVAPDGARNSIGNALVGNQPLVSNPIASSIGPLTVNPHTLTTASPNWSGINVNVTVPGTLVGSGGMQQLSDSVANTMIQTLAARGIRLTRG